MEFYKGVQEPATSQIWLYPIADGNFECRVYGSKGWKPVTIEDASADYREAITDILATKADHGYPSNPKSLKQVEDLKENSANKQNNLTVDGTGTKFPTVDAVNAGLQTKLVSGTNIKTVNGVSLLGSGDVSNLIAEYIHSGNTEIQPTALDLTTGIFTCIGHGITNSVNIFGVLNDFVTPNTEGLKSIPFELVNSSNLYFVRVDNDRFYISLTLNGEAITYTNVANTAINVSNFHFEIPSTQSFSFTGLNLKSGIIRIYGKRGRAGWSYVDVNRQSTRPSQPDGLNWQYLTKIIDFDFKNRIYYSNSTITYYQPTSYNSYGHTSMSSGDVLFINSEDINSIGIGFQFANGFTFQIYKK